MISSRRNKLIKLGFFLFLAGMVTALVLFALRQNISLFYAPAQIAAGKAPLNHPIRLGGMVTKGSLKRQKDSLLASFEVTDFTASIHVVYEGVLPDLFREGQGIVAEGYLIDAKHFQARQVLAKHDEKYMPPEVKNALAGKDGS